MHALRTAPLFALLRSQTVQSLSHPKIDQRFGLHPAPARLLSHTRIHVFLNHNPMAWFHCHINLHFLKLIPVVGCVVGIPEFAHCLIGISF